MAQVDLDALYTLRAEDLSEADLERLTAEVPGDQAILRRLTGPGPKLLKGPRGSGKSNYLKRAYFKLHAQETVLVAYINYSSISRLSRSCCGLSVRSNIFGSGLCTKSLSR